MQRRFSPAHETAASHARVRSRTPGPRQAHKAQGWETWDNAGISIGLHRDPTGIDVGECVERLREHGVVLLDYPTFDLPRFERISAEFCDEFHDIGLRTPVGQGDGLSTAVFPENLVMLPHTEQTYKPCSSPHLCFFHCVTPPAAAGGETTLLDGTTLLAKLSDSVRARFARAGITYEMRWEPPRWRREFDVKTTDELERYLTGRAGVQHRLEGQVLHLRYTTDAITTSVFSGAPALAVNLLSHLPRISHPRYRDQPTYANETNRVCFGDGTSMDDEVITELIDLHDQHHAAHTWQEGDLLLLDNTRFLHGRRTTERPCERVIVSRFGRLRQALRTED